MQTPKRIKKARRIPENVQCKPRCSHVIIGEMTSQKSTGVRCTINTRFRWKLINGLRVAVRLVAVGWNGSTSVSTYTAFGQKCFERTNLTLNLWWLCWYCSSGRRLCLYARIMNKLYIFVLFVRWIYYSDFRFPHVQPQSWKNKNKNVLTSFS
jgi:hypothetical protein